ncbi:BMA-LIM-9, isoform c [Aphelenchoides bicaudatus]|nr:BMA-LIM-9, isoform c [Aphelenchoides bicaudatus]
MEQIPINDLEEEMIATVHPYKPQNDAANSHFKIEDVTDDPRYKDPDGPELERSFVEYCRIDSRHQQKAPNVFEPSSVVSARSVNLEQQKPIAHWRPTNLEKTQMANVIEVQVGQPCTRQKTCNCIGFRPHQWRKICTHCRCDRTEHEADPEKILTVYERIGIKPPNMAAVAQTGTRADPALSNGYSWIPPGLSRAKIEEYMSKLPNHVVPRNNSLGEKYREKQLMVQLPRQDLSMSYCKHLRTAVERRIYEEFVNSRNEASLDIGYVSPSLPATTDCRKCKGIMEKNTMAVLASKLGNDASFHPACFFCEVCEQLLVDLTYCCREDKIYCERHYAELYKPRCSACDELIFSGEYTKAMNKDWHSDHFCCWQCDSTLTGQRYILRDEHPFCIKCYEETFANVCDECGKAIGIDSKDLSYKDKHWHEECFLCSMCRFSLVDQPFGSKNDRIFCSNCYDQAFATRCCACSEIFRAGMKKMEYKGKQWHDSCFCCAMCKSPIGTKSFIPKNDEVFCAGCYEEKYATRCSKCKKVISSGGVTYKNEPWHRECFCCTNCNTSLAGQRFTSKDEKPYCADCFGELFAKRCSACVKPITGIGGAKFISFEDRHWHNSCFVRFTDVKGEPTQQLSDLRTMHSLAGRKRFYYRWSRYSVSRMCKGKVDGGKRLNSHVQFSF